MIVTKWCHGLLKEWICMSFDPRQNRTVCILGAWVHHGLLISPLPFHMSGGPNWPSGWTMIKWHLCLSQVRFLPTCSWDLTASLWGSMMGQIPCIMCNHLLWSFEVLDGCANRNIYAANCCVCQCTCCLLLEVLFFFSILAPKFWCWGWLEQSCSQGYN